MMSLIRRLHKPTNGQDSSEAIRYAERAKRDALARKAKIDPYLDNLENAVARNKIYESIVKTLKAAQ
jgi:hypothetical protein